MSISKTSKIRTSKYDKIWSKMIHARDGVCLVCGSTNTLAAHHVEGRAKKATRLLLENGILLCCAHHVFSSEFSAHKTPRDFKNWFKEKYPDSWNTIQERLKTGMTERMAILEFIEKFDL